MKNKKIKKNKDILICYRKKLPIPDISHSYRHDSYRCEPGITILSKFLQL